MTLTFKAKPALKLYSIVPLIGKIQLLTSLNRVLKLKWYHFFAGLQYYGRNEIKDAQSKLDLLH